MRAKLPRTQNVVEHVNWYCELARYTIQRHDSTTDGLGYLILSSSPMVTLRPAIQSKSRGASGRGRCAPARRKCHGAVPGLEGGNSTRESVRDKADCGTRLEREAIEREGRYIQSLSGEAPATLSQHTMTCWSSLKFRGQDPEKF